MFCPNCGAKNKEDAIFCAECGYKLEEKSKKDVLGHLDQLPIKGKQVIGILSVILMISIAIFYKNGAAYNTPQKALQKYQEYSSAQKYGKLYDLFDIKESDFVNKKTFVQACEDSKVSTEEMMLEDIKKADHKRYFFFDQYQLDCMPSGVREREIYVPYVKGATLEVNGKKVGKECLNKNQTEYVIRVFTPDGMTFTYKNTKGVIKEKEYRVEDQGDSRSYWVNLEYTEKEKAKAKEQLTKTLQALKDYVATNSGTYEDIEQYFATADDAKTFWEKGYHQSGSDQKITKKPQITGSIEINDAQDSEDLRLVDAIAFDVNCTYEYQTVTQGWFNFENNGQLHFDGDTILMRKIGKEWKLDVTSCVWGY